MFGRTLALRRALELLVPAPDVFGRVQGIRNELVDLGGLRDQIVCERGLQLGDFEHGALRRPGRVSLMSGHVTMGWEYVPDLVERVFVMLEHVLVFPCEEL